MKFFQLTLILFCTYGSLTAQSPNSWSQKTSLPGPPREGAVAFVTHQYGFVGAGEDSSGRLLKDFWMYDPGADVWTQVADFGGTPRKNAIAFSINDTGFVGAGLDSASIRKDFYKYNSILNSWTPVEDMDSINGSSPSPGRRDAATFTVQNKAYVAAGYDGTSAYARATWEYDASRDTAWFRKLDFPTGRRWVTGFSIGTSGFVCLGFSPTQQLNHDVWRYDPVLNAWSQMNVFPGTFRASAVSFVIGNKAYVGSGFDGNLTNDFYSYTYATNSWAPVAPLPATPTTGAVAFSINGKGYFFGGSDTSGLKNELWEYTPDSVVGISFVPDNGEMISVFPNPATNLLHIFNKETGTFNFRLYNAAGKLVSECTLLHNLNSLPVDHLAPGAYYYRITTSLLPSAVRYGKIILL